MRKVLIVLSLFFICITSANAQSKDNPDKVKQELKQNFDESVKRMKLNANQQKTFWAITMKYFEKMKTLQASPAENIEKIKSAMALLDQRAAEVKPILTESQYKMYLQIQEERIQKIREKAKG